MMLSIFCITGIDSFAKAKKVKAISFETAKPIVAYVSPTKKESDYITYGFYSKDKKKKTRFFFREHDYIFEKGNKLIVTYSDDSEEVFKAKRVRYKDKAFDNDFYDYGFVSDSGQTLYNCMYFEKLSPSKSLSADSGQYEQYWKKGKTYYITVSYKGVTCEVPVKVAKDTLKGTSLKKLSQKHGDIKCTWKKVSGVSGYEIQVSTSKKFKKPDIFYVSSKKPARYIMYELTNKTYYVRIRTQKLDGEKEYYSKWSKVKKIKTH